MNGGELMATVLRAVLDASPHPHPVATSAHFLRVARPEPAQVQVDLAQAGRTAATARATLIQDDRPVLETTVTTGTLGEPGDGPVLDRRSRRRCRPSRSAPVSADCAELGTADVRRATPAQVDLRLDPATTGWLHGEPAGIPEMRGYFRLREDRDPDAYLLALAVDALPPVVLASAAVGWSPTVELTWHMRAVPAAGPLRVAARGRHVSGGWFDEEAEVWDSAAASSRRAARSPGCGRGRVTGERNLVEPCA